jgi:hypothetical protein
LDRARFIPKPKDVGKKKASKKKRVKLAIPAEAMLAKGQTSGWVPLGQVVDSMNNSKWMIETKVPLKVEFAIPDGKGGLKAIKTNSVAAGKTYFEIPGNVAPNAAVAKELTERYWLPEIRTQEEALEYLLAQVKSWKPMGPTAKRFYLYNIMGFSAVLNNKGRVGELAREIALALGDNTAVNVKGKKRGLVCHWRNPDLKAIEKSEKAYEKSGRTVKDDLRIRRLATGARRKGQGQAGLHRQQDCPPLLLLRSLRQGEGSRALRQGDRLPRQEGGSHGNQLQPPLQLPGDGDGLHPSLQAEGHQPALE